MPRYPLARRVALALLLVALPPATPGLHAQPTDGRGNVIFFHPDGTGLNHWNALRLLQAGPDGQLEWDRLPGMAVYTGHLKDALTGTSHGGATIHAYGVKVEANSFGLDGRTRIRAASGFEGSIAQEAMARGRAVGLIQTGHIAEPGTAAFVASAERRGDAAAIAAQVIGSGAEVILAGGERFLLPKGVRGRHGEGAREDNRDLIAEARAAGYTVVFTAGELKALDLAGVGRLLGVFASGHTFNDRTEEENRRDNRPNYVATAPTIAEMAEAALAILSRDPDGFLLVAEEEGTDNFGNRNNAQGQFEALARADQAVGVFRRFVAASPSTLLLMAADSDAGGMNVIGPSPVEVALAVRDGKIPERDANGAPLDGIEGTATAPFLSAPDRAGRRWPFAVTWAALDDVSGAVLVRAEGRNAGEVKGVIDNTGIYRLIHRTLFGTSAGN